MSATNIENWSLSGQLAEKSWTVREKLIVRPIFCGKVRVRTQPVPEGHSDQTTTRPFMSPIHETAMNRHLKTKKVCCYKTEEKLRLSATNLHRKEAIALIDKLIVADEKTLSSRF